jgi:hypothetical protein
MKVKIKYLLLIVLALGLNSCSDWLELVPPGGLIREEFWKTKEDVESVLMAAYESFAAMDEKLFLLGELRADMLKADRNQPANEQSIMESNIYPDNPYCDWYSFYKIINYTNEVIKNAPRVQEIDNTFSDFRKQSLMAEAYFLRSLCYFYLVRIYNEVPLVLEPTEGDDANFYLPKSSEEIILNQITNDLVENRDFSPSGGFQSHADNKGRASKVAFDALLADIALWRYNYNDVLEHIQKIEISEGLELMPGSKWFEIFYPGNSLESILEFQFDGNLNQRNGMYSLTQQFNEQYEASQKAIERLGKEYATEILRGEDASIAKVGEDDYIIWKYLGQVPDGTTVRTGTDAFSCNWMVYRLADILLMKAEALSQLERFEEALAVLTLVRERANLPPLNIAFTPVAFEDAIMEERAIELAFEGKRWFDLLRMGRRNDYARKSKLIEILVSNVPSTQKRILSAKLTNPLGWFLPIYDKEIERNPNLVQNPYYSN